MNNNNICDCPAQIKEHCRCQKCSGKDKLFDCFHRYSTIMASAGTGKTYNLAMRYLQLLSFGISPEEILAVTFTRKAAGEIFDKIINRLLEMLEEPKCCTLSSKDKLQDILKKLLNGENELRISTIDSFFSRLLQAFAPELGIRNEIQMVDDKDKRVRQKVIRQWIRDASSEEMDELRELLKEANNGKQTGFSSALDTLFKDVYKTYLEYAKDENGIKNQWGTTFCLENAFETLTPEEFIDLDDYFDVYSNTLDDTKYKVAKRCLKTLGKFLSNEAAGNIPGDVTTILDHLNKNNDGNWLFGTGELKYIRSPKLNFEDPGPAEHIRKAFKAIIAVQLERAKKKSRAVYSLMQKFDKIYSREARENGILTFKDLPYMLRGSDDGSGFHLVNNNDLNLEERLDASINHYLFDEFQDTSDTQWYIFENLVGELLTSIDDRFRSFFCVGDIKQSIYQWRGGNPDLFLKVIDQTIPIAEHLGYDSCRSLTESYRSSQDILDTSNRIFGDLRPDAPELLKTPVQKMEYENHVSNKKEMRGFSTLISIGDKVDVLDVKARMILDTIKQVDPFAPGKNLTVGVLQHKNDEIRKLSDALKALAEQEDIDLAVSIDGRISPQDSMAYTFLKQLLILSSHPADKKAKTFLGMLTFDTGASCCPEHLTPQVITGKLGLEEAPDFEKLSQVIRRDIFLNGLSGFVGRFFDAFKSEMTMFDCSRISSVRTLSENYNGGTDEFLEALDEWLETQDQSIKKTVQFMTIHKSKGLEFDVVFIPDTSAGSRPSVCPEIATDDEISNGVRWINYLPVKNICAQIPELEAHNRKLAEADAFAQCCKYYVALTRAKRAMYIFVKLPKKSETFKFEAEMTKQLERFKPDDHYKISFDAMKERCGIEDDGISLVYASGLENWFETIEEEQETSVSEHKHSGSGVKFIYPSKGRRLASHQDTGSIRIPPEARFSAYSAADVGTELHNLFEKIGFVDDDFSAKEFLDEYDPEAKLSAEARELFLTALASGSSIRTALAKPEAKYTLWKERRFLVKDDDGATVPGAFDRVLIYLDDASVPVKAAILDYKSDKVEKSSELISRHRRQLELYRKCLSKMIGIPESEIKISLAALRLGEIAEII